MTIYTIGYEELNIDGFISLLAEHGIDTVVDVRELPLSRKPGFAKKALANHLNLSGYEYIHMGDLGCPKPIRDRYREDGNWKRYTEGFLKHLKSRQEAVEELASLAASSKCVLLCYEADANFCHRSMVAHALKEQHGTRIKHLAAPAKTARPAAIRPSLS
jgi:uncharacterized protein (DUF488 family)